MVGSDSLLSESAQVNSTLQTQTYLQALSPEERRRLLKHVRPSGKLPTVSWHSNLHSAYSLWVFRP